MAFQLGDDQKVKLTVFGVDDDGQQVAATFDAPPTWSSSDESIAVVEPDSADPSGATGEVTTAGGIGPVTIRIQGTGVGGTAALDESFDIEVVTTAEVGFAVVAGTPEHR